jgi:hypothetical protein
MGRQVLILVAGFAILAGLMKLSLESSQRRISSLSDDKYCSATSRNAAHSGAQLALRNMRQNLTWRSGYSNLSVSGASVDVTVLDASDDSTLGVDSVRIISQASLMNEDASLSMLVVLNHPEFPPNVKSGITARANIGTLGNMLVDGRDHDANGVLLSDQGLKAITTTETYVCGGSTALCGTTDSGTDYGPVRSGYSSIVDEHYSWPGSYPSTPEGVLGGTGVGLGANALKLAAQSGIGGGQYVTDPANLHYPLNGVTYVELPNNGTWSPVDFGENGQGILIVHNSYGNALMSNLNGGTFRGMIISDDVVHIHSLIIGGLFLLTDNPREGNCIGNGSGTLLLSRSTIIQALESAQIGMGSITVADCWE